MKARVAQSLTRQNTHEADTKTPKEHSFSSEGKGKKTKGNSCCGNMINSSRRQSSKSEVREIYFICFKLNYL